MFLVFVLIALIWLFCLYHQLRGPSTTLSSTSFQSATSYFWHQHEWMVGILIMGLLLYLRFVHYTEGSWLGRSDHSIFENKWTSGEVTDTLCQYCGIDLEVLCASQGVYYRSFDECESLIGPFLMRHLPPPTYSKGIQDNLPECTLEFRLQHASLPYISSKGDFVTAQNLQPYIQNKTLLEDGEAEMVAKVIMIVISPFIVSSYTCLENGSLCDWDPINFHYSEEDQEILYDYYVKELLDLFASDKALNGKLVHRTWTTNEFLDIVAAVAKLLPYKQRDIMLLIHRVIAKIIEGQGVDDKEASSRHQRRQISSASVRNMEAYDDASQRYEKHEFTLFPCNPIVDQCMYSHYENHTLVTQSCAGRMKEAISKMKELQFPQLVVYTHFSFLIANLTWLLMLLHSCSMQNKYKTKCDKGRRLLEQDLNDPVLREALERKMRHLPEEERDRLLAGLERRVQSWDSPAMATEFFKRWLSRFRYMILFVTLLNLIFGLILIICQVETRAQFLENIFVGVLMYTLSSAVRIHEAKVDAMVELTQLSYQPADPADLFGDQGENTAAEHN
jgi:hypothetical protein